MVFGLPGFTTIAPRPRPSNVPPPSRVQLSPPFVDLYSPVPATQPEAQMWASPVPAYTVSPLGSFGSMYALPAALMPSGPPRYAQCGSPVSAFFVRQTPPPAAVMYARQSPGLHDAATATDVVRPP